MYSLLCAEDVCSRILTIKIFSYRVQNFSNFACSYTKIIINKMEAFEQTRLPLLLDDSLKEPGSDNSEPQVSV